MAFSEGDRVEWDWGRGSAEGRIREIHTRRVTRTIKGSEIVRNGTESNPALVIALPDGGEVLKSSSEVRHA